MRLRASVTGWMGPGMSSGVGEGAFVAHVRAEARRERLWVPS